MAIDKIFNDANVDGIADNIFGAVNNSVSEVKQMQQRKAAENVQMVIQALKKIESDLRQTNEEVANELATRIASIKDGKDGKDGNNAKDGRDGRPGRDGAKGDKGDRGLDGRNGIDGKDGVSVTDAKIDFDGSLIISLSTGQEINVGEVVSPDLADKIQVISTMSTNGAVGIKDEGSSISTGVKNINFVGATVTATNSGDDVTVNVSAGTGTVTSVAATVPSVFSISGSPITTSGTLALTYSGTALPVVNGGTGVTTSTGSGNNVLSTSPTLVTPALGTPSSGVVTNLTGTASININGTVGATTPSTGAFTTLSATTPIATTSGGTGLGGATPFTSGGVVYASSSSVLATGSALTFDGTNLGVGGSPANVINAKSATQYKGVQVNNATNTIAELIGFNASNEAGGLKLYNAGNPIVQILSDGTSYLNGGNVGIGTSSPSAVLHTSSGAVTNSIFATTRASGAYIQYALGASGATIGYAGSASQLTSGTTADFTVRAENNLTFASGGGTERARIDSSGNLLVGTTSAGSDKVRFASAGAAANQLGLVSTDDQSGNGYIIFRNSATSIIGSIARVTTTNAVVYNTTSDYRLKTVVGSVTGQGERIDALKPIDYLWTEGNIPARGFLAHQFQEVYASSVTGTKDAVDADGKPVYQAMQASTSEVIADLVAELQSLRARVAQLESKP